MAIKLLINQQPSLSWYWQWLTNWLTIDWLTDNWLTDWVLIDWLLTDWLLTDWPLSIWTISTLIDQYWPWLTNIDTAVKLKRQASAKHWRQAEETTSQCKALASRRSNLKTVRSHWLTIDWLTDWLTDYWLTDWDWLRKPRYVELRIFDSLLFSEEKNLRGPVLR